MKIRILAIVAIAVSLAGTRATFGDQRAARSGGPSHPRRSSLGPGTKKLAVKVLKTLQRRGKTLRNFSADLRLTNVHPRTGETDTDTGKVWYQKKGHATRFAVFFDKVIVDGSVAQAHAKHDIVFDGRWLIDRDGRSKIFRKTELVPPGKRYNPLKLGEGPVPIPIGQRTGRVLRDFHARAAKIIGRRADTNKNWRAPVELTLTPRMKNRYRFKKLLIVVNENPNVKLPVMITRVNLDDAKTVVRLSNLKINHSVPAIFHLKTPRSNAGWTVVIQPWRKRR